MKTLFKANKQCKSGGPLVVFKVYLPVHVMFSHISSCNMYNM